MPTPPKLELVGPPLTDAQRQALTDVTTGAPLRAMVAAFPDPREAFVCCPVPIGITDLARAYLETVPDEERSRFGSRLRDRCRDERWHEQRAQYQARRVVANREALLQAEAQVWAVVGVEFHVRRLRHLFDRWDTLSAIVQRKLDDIEAGEGAFSTGLRDAMVALKSVEDQIDAIVPKLGFAEAATEMLTKEATDRMAVRQRIQGRLRAAEGAGQAASVFAVVDALDPVPGGPTDGEDPAG